jgi:hypothetical protein
MSRQFARILAFCLLGLLGSSRVLAQEFTVPTIEGKTDPTIEQKSAGDFVIVFYEEIRTKRIVRQLIGGFPGHKIVFCALAKVGTVHATQACSCAVSSASGHADRWVLIVNLDESVNGYCRCQAFCAEAKL